MTFTPEERRANLFKRDTMGRVRLPRARREELLEEYERSGIRLKRLSRVVAPEVLDALLDRFNAVGPLMVLLYKSIVPLDEFDVILVMVEYLAQLFFWTTQVDLDEWVVVE
jgi:hypothetical protein